jgi:serine/threonine protein kinase
MLIDSWAIGVILYELCCNGEHPYAKKFFENETMKERIAFLKTNFMNFEN